MITETQRGTGGLPSKWDAKDRKVSGLGRSVAPFDWTTGFDIETKMNQILFTEDQGNSESCGGQSLRYYLEALNCLKTGVFTRLSAKYTYCQIFYPGGGTTIRDIGTVAVKQGSSLESALSSYEGGNPPTEPYMESKPGVFPIPFFKETAYAFPALDIESVAEAIRDNNGCILQVNGQNGQIPSWTSVVPQPPSTVNQNPLWSHFLYAFSAIAITPTEYQGLRDGIITMQDLKQKYGKNQ